MSTVQAGDGGIMVRGMFFRGHIRAIYTNRVLFECRSLSLLTACIPLRTHIVMATFLLQGTHKSPELNPTEQHLWDVVERELHSMNVQLTNVPQWRDAIRPTWIRTSCICGQIYTQVFAHIHVIQTIISEKLAIFPVKGTHSCTINSRHNIIHSIRYSIFSFRWSGSVPNLLAAMKISLRLWIRPLTGRITWLEIFNLSKCNLDFRTLYWFFEALLVNL